MKFTINKNLVKNTIYYYKVDVQDSKKLPGTAGTGQQRTYCVGEPCEGKIVTRDPCAAEGCVSGKITTTVTDPCSYCDGTMKETFTCTAKLVYQMGNSIMSNPSPPTCVYCHRATVPYHRASITCNSCSYYKSEYVHWECGQKRSSMMYKWSSHEYTKTCTHCTDGTTTRQEVNECGICHGSGIVENIGPCAHKLTSKHYYCTTCGNNVSEVHEGK